MYFKKKKKKKKKKFVSAISPKTDIFSLGSSKKEEKSLTLFIQRTNY